MPVNGVRVLPDIPKNMPNMEILIREFETGFCSQSANSRDITLKSSTSSDSNFVKKIVEAYESSVRASTDNKNCQRERAKRKSDFFNTPDIAQNHKNVKKNSNLGIYDVPRLQCRNNFNKKSNVFVTPFETREIEDDFIILNRYHSESDEKTVSKIWSKASSKINMYGSMDESLINVQSSPLKKNESWNLKRRDQKSENKTNENKLMICSSPLEDVEDKNLDSEDFFDILTSSCDSSSNNSYRNLQADLYNFEDEQWQVELSSTSLSSLKSSESSHNDMLSMNNDDGLILDSSFQDVTVTSSKDIPKNQKNLQNSESVPNLSFNFDQKSSPVIDASLNDDRPIKIDDDNYVTWMSALGEKLSGKKSLKKLLKSAFNTKLLLNYKKLWKKSAEKQSHERTSDSGFIERFLSSSSSSSQKSSSSSSWRSDPNHANEKPSTPLTFATFGRAKNACVSDKTCSKNSRMVLTKMPREKFTNNSEPSDLTTWSPLQHTTTSCKENHWNVESSLKSPILASSSKLKASCGYPPLPKHPYLTRNGIPKHPFVAKAKLETAEKESMEEEEEKEIRCDANEHEFDAHELEASDTSSVCQTELNLSFSRMSEWLTSSLNSDLLRNKISESMALVTNMSTHKHVEERYDDIIKSQNDDRLYRGLVLANKMKVLLISDPTTDKSAAAIDINIGSMCDPDDLLGLAHFCEHMLFLGTEKYPKQNDYNMYLSQNGGYSNAITNQDHTTHYFDINPEKLRGALDRFAQFFLAPLFTETLIELELNAINSEYEINLENDIWRLYQLNKSTASSDHPFSRFGAGNRKTLDIIPKQKGINVRNRLLEFYEKYYSANIMSLCILGKESLDALENMVVDLFCEVPNKEIEVPIWPEHPFKDEHFRTAWYIVPIKSIRFLRIWFPLPDIQQHYRPSPALYVIYLLNHEGEGSLLSALKARYWCNSLTSKILSIRGFSFLRVDVNLKGEGIKHIKDIVQLMFQYINMLKSEGPIEWIYNEYRDITNMNFRFKEKSSPFNYVHSTVQALQVYPMNEVLCAEHVFTEWRPDLINQIMEYLTPKNIRIHVVAKEYEDIADETESWYGTKYKKVKISRKIMEMWDHAGYNTDFQLPSKNKFIATAFSIKPHETNTEKFPIILEDTSFVRLWYKKDDEFLVPRARMIFDFVSPYAYMDPISCNLTHMFVQLLCYSLSEYGYVARLAGLQWSLKESTYGIILVIYGYDENQRVLLEEIIDRMINFEVDPKTFKLLKRINDLQYIGELKNFAAEKPYHLALHYLDILLKEHIWHKNDLLESTAYLSVDRLQQFISQLLSRVHVECLIHGNMTIIEAMDIVKLIESKLTSGVPDIIPLLQTQLVLKREIKLEDDCHFLFEAETQGHKSSCTMVYHPTGLISTESNMLLELLNQIIAEPCYNTLRTNEQLGYMVSSTIHGINKTQGLLVIVQSDKHPQYVEKRINLFLDSMLEHISTMSKEVFEEHKKAVATLHLEKPKMLRDRCTLYWNEIALQQYNFDRVNIEVDYLKTITQQQLLNFYKENVHSTARHKLSIHVISTAALTEKSSLDTTGNIADLSTDKKIKKIDDIMSFKTSQPLYSLLKPFEKNFLRKGICSSKLKK